MSTTNTVKPINTAAMRRANLGAAVKAWLEYWRKKGDPDPEQDIALEAVLVANGTLRPDEEINGMYATFDCTAVRLVLDYDSMEIDTAGNVSRGV